MAKLLGGTQVYGNATINSYLVVSGNADLSGGNVNIGSGNTTINSFTVALGGSNYTSIPTVTISAPTTVYGATASANVQMALYNTPIIVSGGTGYSVGDVLTISGGSPVGATAAKITVTGNSSGVITSVTVASGNYGAYYTLPTNPVSVTGGTGSSATFTANWTVQTVTPTFGGTGYVEQPAVSFSGGGGSGASAYATVGLNTKIQSLGSNLSFYVPQGEILRLSDGGASTINYLAVQGGTSTLIYNAGVSTNVDFALSSKGAGSLYFKTNTSAQTQMLVTHTASAVNYLQVTGGATGGAPIISAQGSDTNVGMIYNFKGTAAHSFNGNGGTHFQVTSVASGANFLRATGSVAGSASILSTQGSDTNVSMVLQPSGSGNVDLTGNLNLSNGSTVTAITGTAIGSGYTTIPAVVISTPTTAGGVQATATAAMLQNVTALNGGGTGYTVNDVLTFVGGTFSSAITVTVTAVSSGVITSFSVGNSGVYTVLPTNPISVTGGTGSGATFNVTAWSVRTGNFTITNAGSGYVEQPTVTFSGGGGSGASAYATVGSATAIKSLHTQMNFYNPNGAINFQVADSGSVTPGYLSLQGGASSAYGYVLGGSTSNTNMTWISRGTGVHSFTTSSTASNEQFRVAHTASAVNYVQVTGATTGLQPSITFQGSDANGSLALTGKGTGNVFVPTGSLTLGPSSNLYMGTSSGASAGILILNSVSTSTPQVAFNASGSWWGTLGPISNSGWGFGYSNTSVSQPQGNIILGWSANGSVIAPQTVSSTSTNTGALIVGGGAGIAGNVTIGGNTNIVGGDNYLAYSNWAGGTSGNVQLAATPPTGWVFFNTTFGGNVTYANAASGVGTSIRFTGTSARPGIQQQINFYPGVTYSYSFNVETVYTTTQIQNIFNIVGATQSYTYYVNGSPVAGSTNLTSNTKVSAVIFVTGVSGTTYTRLGVGVNSADTGDFTLSNPQIEIGPYVNQYIATGATISSGLPAVYNQPTLNFAGGYASIGLQSTGLLNVTAPAGATVSNNLNVGGNVFITGNIGFSSVAQAQSNLQVDPAGLALAMAIALG